MDIIGIIQLFGGIGLFLYGMSMMGAALKKLAGSEEGLQLTLEDSEHSLPVSSRVHRQLR